MVWLIICFETGSPYVNTIYFFFFPFCKDFSYWVSLTLSIPGPASYSLVSKPFVVSSEMTGGLEVPRQKFLKFESRLDQLPPAEIRFDAWERSRYH